MLLLDIFLALIIIGIIEKCIHDNQYVPDMPFKITYKQLKEESNMYSMFTDPELSVQTEFIGKPEEEQIKKLQAKLYQVKTNAEYIEILKEIEKIKANNSLIEEEVTKVEIVNGKFNASKIIEYKGEEIKKFEFRPRNFEEFISQNQAKEMARTIIKKIKRDIKGHLFLSARQGMGKTTFIQLLANELKAKLITRVGKQLDDPDELLNVINEINTTSKEKNIIFFIDEMDSMDKKVIKMLNPIIEQFEVSGKKIKPFIFAGASISKDVLIKNNPDTLDRISHAIHFTSYSAEDIKIILNQYKKQLYPNDEVSEKIITIISNSCKFCPRISISLLEDFIVEQDIQKVLKNRRIVRDGLTEIDIKILKVLNKATRPMGANAVALRSGLSQEQYLQEYEPFLYGFSYLDRTPSRVISKKGKKLLEEIRI